MVKQPTPISTANRRVIPPSPGSALQSDICEALYDHRIHTPQELTELFLEHRYGNFDHALNNCRRVLRELNRRGMVEAIAGSQTRSTPGIWHLTPAGQKLMDDSREYPRYWKGPPAPSRIQHLRDINTVGIALARSARENESVEFAPAGWQVETTVRLRGSGHLTADAIARLESGNMTCLRFIELDRGTQGPREFGQKLELYARLYEERAWRQLFRGPPKLAIVCNSTRGDSAVRRDRLVASMRSDKASRPIRFDVFVTTLDELKADPLGDVWRQPGHVGLCPILGPAWRDRAKPVESRRLPALLEETGHEVRITVPALRWGVTAPDRKAAIRRATEKLAYERTLEESSAAELVWLTVPPAKVGPVAPVIESPRPTPSQDR